MTISSNIITDLLPVYYSGECSRETKELIEEYFQAHPEFAQQAKLQFQNPFPERLAQPLKQSAEYQSLKRTKRLLRLRSTLMGFAIFFSLAPFSVSNVDGKTHWMMLESPTAACMYGAIGVACWIGY
ncbi:MAG TPA: hypothetical protein VMU30_12065, partial [Bacteroidota bacterium]|nr:hypothetical protein [Bacteroidota bacterium]